MQNATNANTAISPYSVVHNVLNCGKAPKTRAHVLQGLAEHGAVTESSAHSIEFRDIRSRSVFTPNPTATELDVFAVRERSRRIDDLSSMSRHVRASQQDPAFRRREPVA